MNIFSEGSRWNSKTVTNPVINIKTNNIISISEKLNCKIITTEKDYMRLNDNDKIFYIKSELKIINQETFINDISKVYENN